MRFSPALQLALPALFLAGVGAAVWCQPAVAPATSAELAEVAFGYLKAGKRELALDTLQRVLEQAPQDYEGNFVAGLLAYQEGRLPDAARHLEAAASARPQAINAALTLGAVYQRMQAYEQAIAVYQRVLTQEPAHAAVHYNMGMLERGRNRPAQAVVYLKRYLALAGNAPDRAEVEGLVAQLATAAKEPTR